MTLSAPFIFLYESKLLMDDICMSLRVDCEVEIKEVVEVSGVRYHVSTFDIYEINNVNAANPSEDIIPQLRKFHLYDSVRAEIRDYIDNQTQYLINKAVA